MACLTSPLMNFIGCLILEEEICIILYAVKEFKCGERWNNVHRSHDFGRRMTHRHNYVPKIPQDLLIRACRGLQYALRGFILLLIVVLSPKIYLFYDKGIFVYILDWYLEKAPWVYFSLKVSLNGRKVFVEDRFSFHCPTGNWKHRTRCLGMQ